MFIFPTGVPTAFLEGQGFKGVKLAWLSYKKEGKGGLRGTNEERNGNKKMIGETQKEGRKG